MDREALKRIARAYLDMMTPIGHHRKEDGTQARAWFLAFLTGIEIKSETGSDWRPSTEHAHISPGTANFAQAVEAMKAGRLVFTATNVAGLVGQAGKDKAAHDACLILAENRISNPPPPLAEWIAAQIRRKDRPRSGAHKHHHRNQAIHGAIFWLLREHGLNPTRNDESSPNSACDIVADVLYMDYGAVRKIWDKRSF